MLIVQVPGLFSIKEDRLADVSPAVAYEPMPYLLGEVCERCWLTLAVPSSGTADWTTFNDAIVPVGGTDCVHGGAA